MKAYSKDLRLRVLAAVDWGAATTSKVNLHEYRCQSTIRRSDPFSNLAEPRLAYERLYALGVPVLAYKTFVIGR